MERNSRASSSRSVLRALRALLADPARSKTAPFTCPDECAGLNLEARCDVLGIQRRNWLGIRSWHWGSLCNWSGLFHCCRLRTLHLTGRPCRGARYISPRRWAPSPGGHAQISARAAHNSVMTGHQPFNRQTPFLTAAWRVACRAEEAARRCNADRADELCICSLTSYQARLAFLRKWIELIRTEELPDPLSISSTHREIERRRSEDAEDISFD